MLLRKMMAAIKGVLPRTLFARSLIILVTPIFLVQIITTYIFFDRHWQTMSNKLAYAVAGEIAMIAAQVEKDDSPKNIIDIQQATEPMLNLAVAYSRGDKLENRQSRQTESMITSREHVITKSLNLAFNSQLGGREFFVTVDKGEKWADVRVQLEKGVLSIVLPQRRIFSSTGYVVLLWMVGSSIVLLIISTIFMRNQIRPIMRLAVAAERIGKGREVPYFKEEGAYEVRQAGRAFVQMRDRLQRQIQQRTVMLAGVSHDLKTPMTRMKLQLELMNGGQDAVDLKNDLADMERMIEAYLQFARGDGNEPLSRVNITDLISQTVKAVNRDKERAFFVVQEDIIMPVRHVAFTRCMENILGNALKYGSHAWVAVRRFGGSVEICVDDDGPGIPPSQYEDVFRPFFRGESSRNAKTGGVGLGLPITQEIVLAHGGRIWLDQSPQGGLRVVIDLPL